MAVRTGHVHHRLPGFFFIIILLTYKKSPFFLRRTGTEKTFFCGTTLIAVQTAISARCQHTGCPLTLAMRQKILSVRCSPCPRRPICCSAFRAPLSSGALSVDALAALLPRLWFALCYDCYTPFVSACQARNCVTSGRAAKKKCHCEVAQRADVAIP